MALIKQKYDIAAMLVDHFDDIDAMNCFNETALQLASTRAPAHLIEKFLQRGANSKLKDSDSNTILHRAVTFNTVQVVSALLKHDKSDVNALTSDH